MMRNPVEPRERYHRSERLRELGRGKRETFNASFVGETLEVLIEGSGDATPPSGLTTNYIRVDVSGYDGPVNRIVPVAISGASGEGCTGSPASPVHAAVA